jgi:hypothetical protein
MTPRWWLRLLILFAGIEIAGILVGSAGLAVEFVYGADVGLILITGGALVFAVGSGLWAKVYTRRHRA